MSFIVCVTSGCLGSPPESSPLAPDFFVSVLDETLVLDLRPGEEWAVVGVSLREEGATRRGSGWEQSVEIRAEPSSAVLDFVGLLHVSEGQISRVDDIQIPGGYVTSARDRLDFIVVLARTEAEAPVRILIDRGEPGHERDVTNVAHRGRGLHYSGYREIGASVSSTNLTVHDDRAELPAGGRGPGSLRVLAKSDLTTGLTLATMGVQVDPADGGGVTWSVENANTTESYAATDPTPSLGGATGEGTWAGGPTTTCLNVTQPAGGFHAVALQLVSIPWDPTDAGIEAFGHATTSGGLLPANPSACPDP